MQIATSESTFPWKITAFADFWKFINEGASLVSERKGVPKLGVYSAEGLLPHLHQPCNVGTQSKGWPEDIGKPQTFNDCAVTFFRG